MAIAKDSHSSLNTGSRAAWVKLPLLMDTGWYWKVFFNLIYKDIRSLVPPVPLTHGAHQFLHWGWSLITCGTSSQVMPTHSIPSCHCLLPVLLWPSSLSLPSLGHPMQCLQSMAPISHTIYMSLPPEPSFFDYLFYMCSSVSFLSLAGIIVNEENALPRLQSCSGISARAISQVTPSFCTSNHQ